MDDIDEHDFRLPGEKESSQAFNAPAGHDFRLPGEKASGQNFNASTEPDFRLPSEKASGKAFLKALRQQKPSWQTDGLGIRGPATTVSNASAKLVWSSSEVTRRTNPEIDAGESEVEAEVPVAP
jgi:hypothetical protein